MKVLDGVSRIQSIYVYDEHNSGDAILIGDIVMQRAFIAKEASWYGAGDCLNNERKTVYTDHDGDKLEPISRNTGKGFKTFPKNLVELGEPKLSEVWEMKDTIEEHYGKGKFDNVVGVDLAWIVNLMEGKWQSKDDTKEEQVPQQNQQLASQSLFEGNCNKVFWRLKLMEVHYLLW